MTGLAAGSALTGQGVARAASASPVAELTIASKGSAAALASDTTPAPTTPTPTTPTPAPYSEIYAPSAERLGGVPVTEISTFQAGHGFYKDSTTGLLTNDVTDFIRGTQSLKMTTNGTGGTYIARRTVAPIDLTGKQFRLWIKCDNPAKLAQCYLFLSSDNLMSHWFTIRFSNDTRSLRENTWTCLTFTLGRDCYINGSPDPKAINCVAFRLVDTATGPVNVWVNELSTFAAPRCGVVSLTFDDGFQSVYTQAKPAMDKYGFTGTAYTICARVGQSGYLSLAQLRALESVGWDISNHTYHHYDLTTLSAADLETELEVSKQWFLANGFVKGAHDVSLPMGRYNEERVLPVARKYFRSARSIVHQVETLPPADQGRLRVFYVVNTMALATVQNAITAALANKEWLILVFHDIQPTAAPQDIQWLTANFAAVMAFLDSQKATVRTVADVLNCTVDYPDPSREPVIPAGTAGQYFRGDKTWAKLDKAAVGLDKVDNTSDDAKNSTPAKLTNKRIQHRVAVLSPKPPATGSAPPIVTPDSDHYDECSIQLSGPAVIAAPAGTPDEGDRLLMVLIQDDKGGRSVEWNAAYRFPGGHAPFLSGLAGASDYLQFRYNAVSKSWDCMTLTLAVMNPMSTTPTVTESLAGWLNA